MGRRLRLIVVFSGQENFFLAGLVVELVMVRPVLLMGRGELPRTDCLRGSLIWLRASCLNLASPFQAPTLFAALMRLLDPLDMV